VILVRVKLVQMKLDFEWERSHWITPLLWSSALSL
jgi:hypothetical protein